MLAFAFFLTSALQLLQGILFPGFSLFAYAPWIALVTLERPLSRALWLSSLSGVIVDLLSDHPFGIHALAFSLTALFLFRFRKHFLSESFFHFSLFSALSSWVGTLLLFFLLFLFDRRVPFAGIWILSDLIMMPLFDGIYALIWVAAPLAALKTLRRRFYPAKAKS